MLRPRIEARTKLMAEPLEGIRSGEGLRQGLYPFRATNINTRPVLDAALAFLDALKVFGLGFSWGGFESLAIDCDPQLRCRADGDRKDGALIRLHIGLEDPADLIADLTAALDAWRSLA